MENITNRNFKKPIVARLRKQELNYNDIGDQPDHYVDTDGYYDWKALDRLINLRDTIRYLLTDKRKNGNHGFTGKQLAAWRLQRRNIITGLKWRLSILNRSQKNIFIGKDERIPNTKKIEKMLQVPCPREVVESSTWVSEKGWVENPSYSDGTIDGVEWVVEATEAVNGLV